MKQTDAIWKRARADLVIVNQRGGEDVFLWEHVSRVAHCALSIARLPMVHRQSPDLVAVLASALYHDAGWIVRLREGRITPRDILVHPPDTNHKEQGIGMMAASMRDLISDETLRRAADAIRAVHDRRAENIEGQVVGEADSLEEFGLVSLWPLIRKGIVEGKGVQAVLDQWARRNEYQFWTARLRDGFRFDPVRALAKKRLARLERFMEELKEHQQGTDVTLALPAWSTDQPNPSLSG